MSLALDELAYSVRFAQTMHVYLSRSCDGYFLEYLEAGGIKRYSLFKVDLLQPLSAGHAAKRGSAWKPTIPGL